MVPGLVLSHLRHSLCHKVIVKLTYRESYKTLGAVDKGMMALRLSHHVGVSQVSP